MMNSLVKQDSIYPVNFLLDHDIILIPWGDQVMESYENPIADKRVL